MGKQSSVTEIRNREIEIVNVCTGRQGVAVCYGGASCAVRRKGGPN